MSKFVNKIIGRLRLFFYGIFYGLRKADETMLSQDTDLADDVSVSHHLEIKSVYKDLLQEKRTQEVEELIDASYRVAREADQYEVTIMGNLGDDSVGSDTNLSAVAVKKVAPKYNKHSELFNEKSYYVTLIQDNKMILKKGNFNASLSDFIEALNSNGNDNVPLINIEYDGFTPRFTLQKFVTKLVVRETKTGKKKLDLYLPSEAGQFTKTDAILIAELHRIMDNNLKKTDFLDISSIKFTTDKAYGAENLIDYTFSGLKYQKISLHDGYFVLTFNLGKVETLDYVEKHKTKTLTEKYEQMTPKSDTISAENAGAIERRDAKLAKKKAQKAPEA